MPAFSEQQNGIDRTVNRPQVEDLVTATLRINGESHNVVFPGHHTLLEVLRESCGLTGTKHGCELGECGACTVLVDGRPTLSCLVLARESVGREIETVEGLASGARLHPLQRHFADLGAVQCGYCTPGILMVAKALLRNGAWPTRAEIRAALAGNLCRCTGYRKIIEAIEAAAREMAGQGAPDSADAPVGERIEDSQASRVRSGVVRERS